MLHRSATAELPHEGFAVVFIGCYKRDFYEFSKKALCYETHVI